MEWTRQTGVVGEGRKKLSSCGEDEHYALGCHASPAVTVTAAAAINPQPPAAPKEEKF